MFRNKDQQFIYDDDSEDSVPSLKIVMLGNSSVGKTSLVKQWSIGIFEPGESPTVCAFSSLHRVTINKNIRLSKLNRSIYVKQSEKQNFEFKFPSKEKKHSKSSFFQSNEKVDDDESEEVDLFLWDTAGQEQYAPLSPLFLREASAIVLTLSIVDRSSFEDMAKWISLVKQFADGDPPIVLAVNKTDMLPSINSIVLSKSSQTENFKKNSNTNENTNNNENSNENTNKNEKNKQPLETMHSLGAPRWRLI